MKSLSDVVGASGLAVYAEIALVIFFVVFVAIAIRVAFMKKKDLEHVSRLPLDDESAASRTREDGAAL